MFVKPRRAVVLVGFVLVMAGCGGSAAEVAFNDDVDVASTDSQSEETDESESTTPDVDGQTANTDSNGVSPEDQAAEDLRDLIAQELTISGDAPAPAVIGEPFEVDVQVAVATSTQLVSVDFVLPDGVLLVGGGCGEGSGTVRCFVADELSSEEPANLAVELVIEPGYGFAVGDVVVVEATATNGMSEFELNELTELTPEDNTTTFEIVLAGPNETGNAESDGASEEEEAAIDQANLIARELTIFGEAPANAVIGQPFEVDVQVAVASSAQLISVDLVLPDGVLLVGGGCGEGSGTVRCFVADELSQEEPAELAVELVIEPGSEFAVGDVVVVEATATNGMSEFELNELTELTPEDNTITFEIEVT